MSPSLSHRDITGPKKEPEIESTLITFWERAHSYFEKGCRKKCTRQSRKVLWVVLSLLFFKEIWKSSTRGHGHMFASAKEKQQKIKVGSTATVVRNSVLIISHIAIRDCRVHIFFRQLFSKYLYKRSLLSGDRTYYYYFFLTLPLICFLRSLNIKCKMGFELAFARQSTQFEYLNG